MRRNTLSDTPAMGARNSFLPVKSIIEEPHSKLRGIFHPYGKKTYL
jgi:hypothetical protein